MYKRLGFVTGLICAVPLSAAPQTEYSWQCNFTERSVCGATTCTTKKSPAKGGVWIYLTPSQQSYYRCEGDNFDDCDHYKATITDSGAFKTFELPGRAAFAKVGADLSVTEVVTQMDLVYINRGRCMSAPPPLIRTGG